MGTDTRGHGNSSAIEGKFMHDRVLLDLYRQKRLAQIGFHAARASKYMR
jgi:hypothetical protein